MSEATTCPRCGAPLPTGTELDDCPRCLLAAGLQASESDSRIEAPDTPTLEELAGWFPQFEILELVGRGGMGVVYKARQLSLDRVVALKILPASLSDDPAFADRFTREAKTMARLDHPNIVRVHEFGQTEGRYFLLMEYVNGSNLRQVMEAGGLEPREALAIVPQVCEALQYAHDRGVVHRDIKPENVLLDRMGHVKLTDFGLAKLVHDGPHEKTLTAFGQVMGTPQYMAPEQYKTPQDVDHRADIYSLGVVFYEMLTGDVPMGRFDPPSEKVEVDVRLDEVVLRTLEKERDRRYQRVDDVRTEVTSITSTSAAPAARRAKRPPPPPAAPPPATPVSRQALAGFLCLPALFVAPFVGIVIGRLFGTGELAFVLSLGAVVLTLVLGFSLSIAGWVVTARSRGALKGQGLAIAGTIAPVPLFLLLLGFSTLFLYSSVDEPSVREFPGPGFSDLPGEEWEEAFLEGDMPMPERVPPLELEGRDLPAAPVPAPLPAPTGSGTTVIGVPEGGLDEVGPTLEQVQRLWTRLLLLARGEKVAPADLERLVAPVDRERVTRARRADRERLQAQAFLGLPFPPSSVPPLSLEDYHLETVDFSGIGASTPWALVTARSGAATLTFDLVWDGNDCHYAITPLGGSATPSYDKPELVRDAPDAWSRTQRRNLQTQVELLWSLYNGLWDAGERPLEARVDPDLRRWVLPARSSATWRGHTSADLAEQGRDGDLGLLFLDATTLPAPLADYRLATITVSEDGDAAAIVAEAGSSKLTFPVVWDEGRWWLDVQEVRR